MKKQKYLVNNAIKLDKLLVIDDNGQNLGVIDKNEALQIAQEKELDLVLFSTGDQPIAKIIDYGKFVYDSSKKNKNTKKKHNQIKNKEIKVKPQIGMHDLQVRVKNAKEWLSLNYRVRFVILAYGRIGYKTELINDIYHKFIELLGDCATIQAPLKKISKVQYEAYFVPNKNK